MCRLILSKDVSISPEKKDRKEERALERALGWLVEFGFEI